MKILITSVGLDFPMELARSLSKEHEITLTDRRGVSTDLAFVHNDLDEGSETDELVRGIALEPLSANASCNMASPKSTSWR